MRERLLQKWRRSKMLVARGPHPPGVFVRAESKGVASTFRVRAHSKELSCSDCDWEKPVGTVATGRRKRGLKLLILKGRFGEVPPPRVFCKKRLDFVDYKGVDFFGDDKEAARD